MENEEDVLNATVGCNCQAGAEPPALHGDNCPVLFRWLRQTIPAGEAEVAAAAELHTLDTTLNCRPTMPELTLPVMSDPDAQIVAGHSFAGWDIAEWCRWSISTSDDIEDDPTLYLVVSTRGEQFIRTVTPEQMRDMASYLTQLAEHVEEHR